MLLIKKKYLKKSLIKKIYNSKIILLHFIPTEEDNSFTIII